MSGPYQPSSVSEEVRRLAGELGVDVDDPLVRLLAPIAEVRQEIRQWQETNVELLQMLRHREQEADTLKQGFRQLVECYATLEPQLNQLQANWQQEQAVLQQLPERLREQVVAIQNQQGPLLSPAELGEVSPRQRVQWEAVLLAISLAAVCFFFGRQQGFGAGQLDIAGQWFGSVENADYWRQVRNLNVEATQACQQQGQSTCQLQLPQPAK